MDVIHYPDDRPPAGWTQTALALGNFDGLHRGHTKLIERVRSQADERGGTAAVLTFDPHPPRVVRPDRSPPLLMTLAQKLQGLAALGMDGAAVVRFTPELSRWDPERFVRTVLVEWLAVRDVWVGANFLFGRDRRGNFSLLRALGAQYGFRASAWPVRYRTSSSAAPGCDAWRGGSRGRGGRAPRATIDAARWCTGRGRAGTRGIPRETEATRAAAPDGV